MIGILIKILHRHTLKDEHNKVLNKHAIEIRSPLTFSGRGILRLIDLWIKKNIHKGFPLEKKSSIIMSELDGLVTHHFWHSKKEGRLGMFIILIFYSSFQARISWHIRVLSGMRRRDPRGHGRGFRQRSRAGACGGNATRHWSRYWCSEVSQSHWLAVPCREDLQPVGSIGKKSSNSILHN